MTITSKSQYREGIVDLLFLSSFWYPLVGLEEISLGLDRDHDRHFRESTWLLTGAFDATYQPRPVSGLTKQLPCIWVKLEHLDEPPYHRDVASCARTQVDLLGYRAIARTLLFSSVQVLSIQARLTLYPFPVEPSDRLGSDAVNLSEN
jgi:hypothetical protein